MGNSVTLRREPIRQAAICDQLFWFQRQADDTADDTIPASTII